MITPSDNSNYPRGSGIVIAANASDPDGTITKVEFFNGANKLGGSTANPYEFLWVNPPSGKYSLTAVAIDNQNATTTSTVVPITITSGAILDSMSTGIVFGLFAPDAALDGGMTLFPDSTATKGSYFAMPKGNGTNNSAPPPAKATFYFQLPMDDNFIVWVRVKSTSPGHRGYFVNAGSTDWTLWQADINTIWSWIKISDPSTG